MEAAFQYVNEFHENVLGFCNNIYNAEGGTHLTGFKTTFTTVMNTLCESDRGILKDKDANFTGADMRNGMTAVVSIKHPDPRFEGQTKTKLDNQDAAQRGRKGDRRRDRSAILIRIWKLLKSDSLPVRRNQQRSEKQRNAPKRIC